MFNASGVWKTSFVLILVRILQFNEINCVSGVGRGGFRKGCPIPLDFPHNILLEARRYENWVGDIVLPSAWIAVPKNTEDVVKISNWAVSSGYRIRAKGGGHNFSPLTLSKGEASIKCPKVILVDTTIHLKRMSLLKSDKNSRVEVETGVLLDDLLQFLEKERYGIFACPEIGDISIGGLLATGTHGTGIPGRLDEKSQGQIYGSMSNLILEMTIVAWDKNTSSYRLKRLTRYDEDCSAFMTHMGRAFVTSVSLSVGKNINLRKISRTDISAQELFADPSSAEPSAETFSKLANKFGRVEIVTFPFGKYPWVLYWHNSPEKPSESVQIDKPYPYIFMDYVPRIADIAAEKFMKTFAFITKYLGTVGHFGLTLATAVTSTKDLWGPSKNMYLNIPRSTMHINLDSFAVLTSPEHLQKVLSIIYSYCEKLLFDFAERKQYPMNGGLAYRISGIDNSDEIEFPNTNPPCISPASPFKGNPQFTRVIWLDFGSFPNTSDHYEFMTEFESFLFQTFKGELGFVRPQWSKGYAYTKQGPWTNSSMIKNIIPQLFQCGSHENGFAWAVSRLNFHDPHKIFTNDYLEYLLS